MQEVFFLDRVCCNEYKLITWVACSTLALKSMCLYPVKLSLFILKPVAKFYYILLGNQ